jgi:cytochrome c oxidase subunit IV
MVSISETRSFLEAKKIGFGDNIGKSIRIIEISSEIHYDIPISRVKLMNMPIIIILFILSYGKCMEIFMEYDMIKKINISETIFIPIMIILLWKTNITMENHQSSWEK